jgi:hypothetical protein
MITNPVGQPSTEFLDLNLPSNFMQQDVGLSGGKYIRQIGTLPSAHVTIEEDHDDELIITQHPVEFGAIISDHAYKKPAEVRIRCAWNNSGSHFQTHGVVGSYEQPVISGYEGYSRAIYDQILALQESRVTFSVITGKRIYNDMLVASIRVHTAPGSEYSLLADISLREIILVATKTLNIDNTSSRMPNASGPLNQGQVTTTETTNWKESLPTDVYTGT